LAVQNGSLYAWGDNTNGDLGDGTTTNRLAPVAISGLTSGVTAVAAGNLHSLAVQNGSVFA
jgi:alpha-tubulin suppressor-like RCC1 family protein